MSQVSRSRHRRSRMLNLYLCRKARKKSCARQNLAFVQKLSDLALVTSNNSMFFRTVHWNVASFPGCSFRARWYMCLLVSGAAKTECLWERYPDGLNAWSIIFHETVCKAASFIEPQWSIRHYLARTLGARTFGNCKLCMYCRSEARAERVSFRVGFLCWILFSRAFLYWV